MKDSNLLKEAKQEESKKETEGKKKAEELRNAAMTSMRNKDKVKDGEFF